MDVTCSQTLYQTDEHTVSFARIHFLLKQKIPITILVTTVWERIKQRIKEQYCFYKTRTACGELWPSEEIR